jgi:arylsulfatase A-like enzyme
MKEKSKQYIFKLLMVSSLMCWTFIGQAQKISGTPGSPTSTYTIQGKSLPIAPLPFGGVIKTSAVDSKPYWPARLVPPKGSPNILLIMTDDQGYGVSSTFGGVIPTPGLERVAKAGLRYTQFHSTALCSPTRAALITGRNHHSVGSGVIGELSTGYPGYNSIIGLDNASIGNILEGNGYSTSWFGKNHNTPNFQYSVAGPYDQWPSGQGFQYFYGFMGGETDQWTPYLFRDHTQIFPFVDHPGYNLTTDLADEAIKHMRDLNAAAPDKPFFTYYVPGGTHSPHQPTREWIEKFKGRFDMGYEKLRDIIFENQKKLGVIPANAQLTPWPESIPRWDSLSFLQKKLFARQAEVFAAYAAYTDFEINRVIQSVEDMGKLDNTIIIYICGDNGTSPEGTLYGAYNQLISYNGILEPPMVLQMLHYNEWGSDQTYPHMAVGWAWAFDTPFKWTKQVASHFGGTRQGLAISWPGHIKDVGGIRSQFHHVIDIVPTILEATGIQAPDTVNGIKQKPIEGVSMLYTFDAANANAPSTHTTQYFEMASNRGIYHDGWYANTVPFAPPWLLATGKLPNVDSGYKWELYNLKEDFTQYNDLSAKYPDTLKKMQVLFLSEAAKYNVLPLDNTAFSRLLTPRPSAVAGKTEFTYTGENVGIPLGNAPSILDRDYTITAQVTVPSGGADGMIATLGGRFGGYGLFMSHDYNWWLKGKFFTYTGLGFFILGLFILWRGQARNWKRWKIGFGKLLLTLTALWLVLMLLTSIFGLGRGRPVFVYNFLDMERFRWEALSGLGSGKHTIVFDFKYDGPGPAKGGTGVLSVDGKEVATKTMAHTIPLMMTIDETFDIGMDTRSPVVEFAYDLPFRFTGNIDSLKYKLGPEQINAVEKQAAVDAAEKAKD